MDKTFITRVYNRSGLLVRFASVLTRLNLNIKSLMVTPDEDQKISTISFIFESQNDKQTATVRRNLLKQLDVLTVNDGFCHY
ncbi:ACT domain-containing protein [Leuconostoc mesenteroides]|uniref:ACT domain-containing protein n=1 Tax=Leuconostoc mesenteroides TaxID=1245 RepID=UPI001CBFD860|nr:ACT domain-containing protein [Leuconostoc mesenteroides]MBZ1530950.1 ACT domain-containing protein [Leuconostoc mesenteroides]